MTEEQIAGLAPALRAHLHVYSDFLGVDRSRDMPTHTAGGC